MLKKLFFVAVAAALLSGAPQAADAKAKVIKKTQVTPRYVTMELKWFNQPDPGFILKWETRVINGEIAICGAVAFTNLYLRAESRRVLARTKVRYKDKIIMRSIMFVNKVPEAEIDKATAYCASTGVKAPKGQYTVNVSWDRGRG